MTLLRLIAKWLILLATLPCCAQTAVPSFEVATIKAAAPSSDGHTHINYPMGDRFSASNITLRALMVWAYRMPARQILGGPGWLDLTAFDIVATTGGAETTKVSSANQDLKRRMVQGLLAERFQLAVHTETRKLPTYDLVLAKGGSKLEVSKDGNKMFNLGRDHINSVGITAALFAEQLAQATGRAVVDKTGLTERYDVKLVWAAEDAADSGPSLFTAVQEQLGLKLEPASENVPVVVVDRVVLPSAN